MLVVVEAAAMVAVARRVAEAAVAQRGAEVVVLRRVEGAVLGRQVEVVRARRRQGQPQGALVVEDGGGLRRMRRSWGLGGPGAVGEVVRALHSGR